MTIQMQRTPQANLALSGTAAWHAVRVQRGPGPNQTTPESGDTMLPGGTLPNTRRLAWSGRGPRRPAILP